MNIEGTVTISIKTFDEMRAAAKQSEEYRLKLQAISREVTGFVSFDDVAYLERLEEIEQIENISDKKLEKALSEALSIQKIVIDGDKLKKFIKKYIDDEKSQNCADIANAKESELKTIGIAIKQEE